MPVSGVALDDADEGQFAEGMRDVHAVADDEIVRAVEADIVGIERRSGGACALSSSTAMETLFAPRDSISSRVKVSVLPDSRMSSISSTSRPATSLSMSRSTLTSPLVVPAP